jgi:hypothetical protein
MSGVLLERDCGFQIADRVRKDLRLCFCVVQSKIRQEEGATSMALASSEETNPYEMREKALVLVVLACCPSMMRFTARVR